MRDPQQIGRPAVSARHPRLRPDRPIRVGPGLPEGRGRQVQRERRTPARRRDTADVTSMAGDHPLHQAQAQPQPPEPTSVRGIPLYEFTERGKSRNTSTLPTTSLPGPRRAPAETATATGPPTVSADGNPVRFRPRPRG